MNMKEICRKYIDALGNYISDSFYDDEGGDYVELDIFNPVNDYMSIEIEIDSSYFGFVCHNYDEMYYYDEDTEENLNRSIEKINGIITGTLCEISLNAYGQPLSTSETAEVNSINNEFLDKIISSCGMTKCSGQIKICYWNRSPQIYLFENGIINLNS